MTDLDWCEGPSVSNSVTRAIVRSGRQFAPRLAAGLLVAALVGQGGTERSTGEDAAAEGTESGQVAAEKSAQASTNKPKYTTTTACGRVVWMAEALNRRFGIKSDVAAAQRLAAVETPTGRLIPIVEDVRGTSFRLDPRLVGVDMELLVRRYEGSPMVQVIRIYRLKKSGKFEIDYWCDICAISMLQLKPCDCCQGPIELRERRTSDSAADPSYLSPSSCRRRPIAPHCGNSPC